MKTKTITVVIKDIEKDQLLVTEKNTNKLGYIPSKEYSWNRSKYNTANHPSFEIGQELQVINTTGNQYSIKQVSVHPWKQNIKDLSLHQCVLCEVVSVQDFAVYAQVVPGIDSIIYPYSFPFGATDNLVDLVRIGDYLYGQIINIDQDKQLLELSCIGALELLNEDKQTRKAKLLSLFEDCLQTDKITPLSTSTPIKKEYYPPLSGLRHVLIIDDEQEYLQRIKNWLTQYSNGKMHIDLAKTSNEAIDILAKGKKIDLIISDYRLNNETGIDSADKILDIFPKQHFLFISNNNVEQNISIAFNNEYPFALKTEDGNKLIETLEEWQDGTLEKPDTSLFKKSKLPENIIPKVNLLTTKGKITTYLNELNLSIRARYTFLLKVNDTEEKSEIYASATSLNESLKRDLEYNLYFSPVKDISFKKEAVFDQSINKKGKKFQYFFPDLEFSSYYGLALDVIDTHTYVLLCLFDLNIITGRVLREILLTSKAIEATLEKNILNNVLEEVGANYSKGILLDSAIHELRNKVNSLIFNLGDLKRYTDKFEEIGLDDDTVLDQWKEVIAELQTNYQQFGELLSSYATISSGAFNKVNINALLHKMLNKLKLDIEATRVEIELDSFENLPLARSVESRLEQVFLNVLLNASQHTGMQYRRYYQDSEANYQKDIFTYPSILVKTSYNTTENMCQVHIIDTGPGIHRNMHQKIFQPRVTTRIGKGQGLGLYISKVLIQALGGSVSLDKSILFIGSLFTIKIPAVQVEKNDAI